MTDPEPRWLDPRERQAWIALSALLLTLPGTLDAQLQRDAGMTFYEYMVLAGLSERPGRSMRMSELSALTNGSLSRLSHVVKRLEGRGHVVRAPDPADGRFTRATLTDAGFDVLAAAAPGHVAHVRETVVDALSHEQVGQLGAIGSSLLRGLLPPDDWARFAAGDPC